MWDMEIIHLNVDIGRWREYNSSAEMMAERERVWSHLRSKMNAGWEPFAVVPEGKDTYKVFVKKATASD